MGESEFRPWPGYSGYFPLGLYFLLLLKGLFPDPQKAKLGASLKTQDPSRCSWEAVGGTSLSHSLPGPEDVGFLKDGEAAGGCIVQKWQEAQQGLCPSGFLGEKASKSCRPY